MASPAAILRAARAAPGPVSPSPAPQGSVPGLFPSYGQLPQYTTQPPGNYSYEYGPFLPRAPQDFTSGAFGPMSPILPVPIDQPGPGLPRAQPRRWQPYVGYNLPVGQPGTEGYKLASFATLKQLGDYYSIMRTCLEIRKSEMRALDWDIVLTQDAAKAYRGDREAMRDFGERRAKAIKWFRKPDPNYFSFSSWLYALAEQLFVYDALSLYMCPTRARGAGKGLLGCGLDSLWSIDGASIRPLMGLHGETPRPPAPAYQQFEYAVPRADLMTMRDGRDLADHGLGAGDMSGQWRGDQLLYLPYVQRNDSPYGFSLVEQAIIPVMTGLRKQAYQMQFFDESSVPRVYISPGDSTMTPNQIRELQDAINAISGDLAWMFKAIVLPPGSKVLPQKQMEIVDQADEWIATEVAMVASVNPMEIGVIPRVSTVASPFAAREMAQAGRSIHQRIATKPTLKYFTEIFDVILQVVAGQEDMRFLFSGMEEEQDLAAQTDMGIKQAQSGIKSIDEVRDTMGLTPWGLPETSGPVVFTTAGPLPLGQGGTDTVSDDVASVKPLTDAHAAAQGHAREGGQRAIPAGRSGVGRMNGPVTQRQARRGGALAPAHSTAEGAPGRSGGKPAAKAALAELEALGRHLRKGRDIATWEARHLPGAVMGVLRHDLADGHSLADALDDALLRLDTLTKAAGQSPKGQQRNRRQRQALAQQYTAQVQGAFAQAVTQARALVAAWVAGTLAVTAAALAAMIAELVRDALLVVLLALWRAAWALGSQAARGAAKGHYDPEREKEALEAFLASYGADLAGLISRTRIQDLAGALAEAARSGDPGAVAAEIERILRVESRAGLIAETEVTRAANAAAVVIYQMAGVAYKTWETRRDGKVCPVCRTNQDAGPVPISGLFPSRDERPPGHPRCRCWLGAWQPPPPATASKATRRVELNGQETVLDDDDLHAAGGGADGARPHDATGTQYASGAMTGGEPPRWDGTEPEPRVLSLSSGDDGQRMGGRAGTGTPPRGPWPVPYMDGYWPQGGIGTGQAPMSSPGGGERGRPPNSVGKGAQGVPGWLAAAPKAKAATVLAQLAENYPPASIAWVKGVKWRGPIEVPLEDIDWDSVNAWAAHHEMGKVEHFVRQFAARERVNPAVGIIRPGEDRVRIVDGHHRSLACRHLGWPSRMYVGWVTGDATAHAALEAHSSQVHQGADPANR